MKYCPYCQTELNDSAAFCRNCGSPQPAAQQFDQTASPVVPQQFEQPANTAAPQQFEQPINQVAEPTVEQPVNQPVEQMYEQPAAQQFDQQYTAFNDQGTNAGYPVTPTPQTYYQDNQGYTQTNTDHSANTVIDTIKKLFGSPLVMVIALLISFSVFFQFASSIIAFQDNRNTSLAAVESAFDSIGGAISQDAQNEFMSGLSQTLSGFSSLQLAVSILSLIFPALTALGFWMIYSAGKQKQPGIKTGGLTTLKVIGIIQLVLICVAAALSILFVAIFHFAFSSSVDSTLSMFNIQFSDLPVDVSSSVNFWNTVFIILYVVLAVIFAIRIIYKAKIVSSENAVKKAIGGVALKKASAFAAVMLFIFGAFSLISAVSSSNALDVVASLTTAGYQICIGVLIFQYNGRIDALKANMPQ